MPDREKVKYDIERCICHVPDACRDCSHYKHGEYLDCMEELLKDALALLNEQDNCENCAIAIEDRQPIVRCKDCKAWKQYDDMNLGECELYPEYNKMGDWFCNFGERKEGR